MITYTYQHGKCFIFRKYIEWFYNRTLQLVCELPYFRSHGRPEAANLHWSFYDHVVWDGLIYIQAEQEYLPHSFTTNQLQSDASENQWTGGHYGVRTNNLVRHSFSLAVEAANCCWKYTIAKIVFICVIWEYIISER